jgi:cell wall-associated NlpC family hydrolase
LPFSAALALVAVAVCVAAGGLAAPSAASAETQGQAIVADAQQYLGDAYCWEGGTLTPTPGPSHGKGNAVEWYGGNAASGCNNSGPEDSVKGFDCSGLAMVAVYEATGIALPHKAQEQSTYGGTSIGGGLGNAAPGDLLFFGPSAGRIEHVGIYLGGGRMINAYDYKNDGDNGPNNEYWGVTEMPVSWETYAFPLQKIVRYWSGSGGGGSGPPMTNGSYIRTPNESIYVVAGGAAIHVDNCGPLGGCPGVVEVPNLDGYATEPSTGTFLRVADGTDKGLVARVVGGVPLGLTTCEGMEGEGCATALVNIDSGGYSDYAKAHEVIANGTFVRVADGPKNGLIGRVVGGVLLGLLTCEGMESEGCEKGVNVAEDAYVSYAAKYHTIANGTFVRVADGSEKGLVGRVVGGVLLGLLTCEGMEAEGCAQGVNVAENVYNYYASEHHIIENGTFVRVADGPKNGLIGRVVGGVLLGLLTCEGMEAEGCASGVNVAENVYTYYASEHHVIENGTFVRVADGPKNGLIGRVVGGALLGLLTCEGMEAEGCAQGVNVAENAYTYYAGEYNTIANGTYIRVADGPLTTLVARAAGGALLGLTSCVPLEECPGQINVAENVFTSYTAEHPQPANGTILEGLPSGTYWSITNGERTPTSASTQAVAVDDTSLDPFPISSLLASGGEPTQTAATAPTSSGTPGDGVLGTKEQVSPSAHVARLANTSIAASRNGTITVKIACPNSTGTCTGKVTVKTLMAVLAANAGHHGKVILTLASGNFTAPAGRTSSVALRLSANGRSLLARTRTLRARVTVTGWAPKGIQQTTVTIHAPAPRRAALTDAQVASAALVAEASAAGRCGPGTVTDALGRTPMRFVLRGHISCAIAHRVVSNYYRRAPTEGRGSGGFVTLPSGWTCHSEPGEITQKTGHITVCERGRATINTYKQ